jgi:hypothetical protein
MKRSHLPLVIALTAIGVALPLYARADDAIDPRVLAKAREVLAAELPADQKEKMLGMVTGAFSRYVAAANPGREADVDQLVQVYFIPVLREHMGELSDIGARRFARGFTLNELDQLLAFYRSDLGRKLVEVQGKLDPDMMTQGPVITQRIFTEALQKMAPEMQKQGLVAPSL